MIRYATTPTTGERQFWSASRAWFLRQASGRRSPTLGRIAAHASFGARTRPPRRPPAGYGVTSTATSPVTVRVIRTDEAQMIAWDVARVLGLHETVETP